MNILRVNILANYYEVSTSIKKDQNHELTFDAAAYIAVHVVLRRHIFQDFLYQ